MNRVLNYINGKDLPPSTGRYIEKTDPRTGNALCEVADSGKPDMDAAVGAAMAALPAWRAMRPAERGRILVEIGRAVRDSVGTLGRIESAETGKPGREMPQLMVLIAQYFEFYGGIVNTMDGEVINAGPDYHVYTRRDPFGVIGVMLAGSGAFTSRARITCTIRML